MRRPIELKGDLNGHGQYQNLEKWFGERKKIGNQLTRPRFSSELNAHPGGHLYNNLYIIRVHLRNSKKHPERGIFFGVK